MSILIEKSKRVLVQGITGREGMTRTKLMVGYGTQVVAGVTPGRGGQEVEGIPVREWYRDQGWDELRDGIPIRYLIETREGESFEVEESAVELAHGREWVRWRGERVPLTRLQALFKGGNGNGSALDGVSYLSLVGLEFGHARLVISVDQFLGEEEIVIKPFDPPRGAVPVFSGAIVRPDGRPALVLDVGSLS